MVRNSQTRNSTGGILLEIVAQLYTHDSSQGIFIEFFAQPSLIISLADHTLRLYHMLSYGRIFLELLHNLLRVLAEY
jgi:hypothetical protein